MKLTMDDIAKICGVSRGTVNRALYNKPGINEDTKQKILKVVDELGYYPNHTAQSLATGKTNTIGLIVPDVDNQFCATLYSYMEDICWKLGYFMVLAISNDDPEKESKYIETFIKRNVDGIICIPVNKNNSAVKRAINQNIPVVLLLNKLKGIDTNLIMIDDYYALKKTTQYLIDMGHRNIMYIDGIRNYSNNYIRYINDERLRGFKDALKENGIQFTQDKYGEFLPEFYNDVEFRLIKKIIDMKDRPTSIICFHDKIAIWALKGFKEYNLKIPDDISIVGFDDLDELRYIEPALTTNRSPIKEIAELSFKMLLDSMNMTSSNSEKIVLKTELIQRESVKKI